MDTALADSIALLAPARRILAFTGAGISTESGIPDFRGPHGVWTRIDPSEFTFDKYVSDASTRRRSWQMRSESGILDAGPNAGHRALVGLWKAGLLAGCVTQNIDGLHQAAGLPDEAVVELHGNAHTSACLDCGADWPTTEILARVESGEDDPHCPHCGGIVKVTVISFGQMMPGEAMERAYTLAATCDAVLAIGSTLSVYPAAYIPLEAAHRGVPYVIVNQGATDHDVVADACVEGPAGPILTTLVEALTAGKK